ncbi:uncharacterized protein LOC130699654 [Daphnia carinata]|uniref:uncharacterized protein LOC130699654 n=1 Tax=Daphnia carinata TaxID=120202 RepID=UPI00257C4C62|nr:uncharacterized protein LOC130699654 [Daphnia carinata]
MSDRTSGEIYEESHLIQFDEEQNEHPVVIICGVAGTGKSTLLSHYYSEIKKKKPDCWVIKLNLVEHSDAILKLDRSRPDLIGFLINHLHVVENKSQFSRSLLNHRFETGDQIVFMFDGYDEIGEECQKIVIQLMKFIQEKKGIQLYITTRPHLAHDLQYELCQLAYCLENFNREDQINCLIKYWKKELPDEGQDRAIKIFAESLVDRVSQTLKDEERAFIGIPLQCKILAECYQQNVGDIVESTAVNDVTFRCDELVSQKLLALLDDQKFDLVSLYSKLMDTKRDVFRKEKTNTSNSNQIVANAIDNWIMKIESHLTKLAIETIMPGPNILEMFTPTTSLYKSSDDVTLEEKTVAIDSLNFGLTFSNGDGMQPQFLHRTFAEYLVAKYLYEGFHLDDKRHNKLLENESIRKLFLNKILALKQYDGVQVFFDSMVKTLVDEDQEWRYKINHRQLPDQLTKLTENLFTQFLRNFPPIWAFDGMMTIQPYFANALRFSLSNGKGNIFLLLCDCLDATFVRQQIHWAMDTSFIRQYRYFSATFFKENKLFKRFINYFDIDPHDSSTYGVIEKLIKGMFPDHPAGIIESNSFWERDGHQQTMNDLLQFLENQHIAFDEYFHPNRELSIKPILVFLICHGNNRSHLERFLKLLSKSKAYSDDMNFANLLMKVFRCKEQMMAGQIAETLHILQEIGRSTLLVQLYGGVLSREPEAFQNIYQPFPLEHEDAILLGWDDYGMTLLHGAAFYGNVEIVEQILASFPQPELDDGVKEAVRKVVLDNFTPFYFAAAKNHEEICSKLLVFVKDFFPDALTNESTELNGFIQRSVDHAMESENAEMFQLVLNVVKKELGHDYLLHLLTHFTFPSTSIFDGCRSDKLFNAMVKIIVDRNGVVDYKCLNNLIFNTKRIARDALRHMDSENLQGLLSVEGAGPFTKRLLTSDTYLLSFNFQLLSSFLLKNFNETQLLDFVKMITLKGDTTMVKSSWPITVSTVLHSDPTYRDENIQHLLPDYSPNDLVFTLNDEKTTTVHDEGVVPRNSFWGGFLRSAITSLTNNFITREDVQCVFEFLTCVSDKLGGDCAKQLFLHQDDYGYVFLHLSQEIVKLMMKRLPEKSQEEIKQKWKEHAPPMTHDSFFNHNSTSRLPSSAIAKHYSDVLRFYLDYGSEEQRSRCDDILTSVRSIKGQERSVWSYIFEHCEVTTTNEILKSMSQIFGWEAVKKWLFHEVDGFPLLLKAVSWGDDIEGRLDMLPQEIRNDIQQVIERRAAEFIDQVFRHHETYCGELGGPIYKRLNTLIFLIKYSNAQQLEEFVKNITTLQVPTRMEKTLSLWAEMLAHPCDEAKTNNFTKMNTFLKCISEKLDTNAVKELVLHKIDDNPVIYYPAVRGEEQMVDAMLAHLDTKNRKKIQLQVNEFLNKTFEVPSDGTVP